MIKWSVFLVLLAFTSCQYFIEEETVRIVSAIDGEAYYEDMDGEMNARKGARMILEGKVDSVSYKHKLAISDSLVSEDSIWRNRYFSAINLVINKLDSLDMDYVSENAFVYFLHYPKELLNHLNNDAFEKSDYWNNILAYQFHIKTAPDDITPTSVINRAHKYCIDCDPETMDLIIQYVSFLETYQEPLMFNSEVIAEAIL